MEYVNHIPGYTGYCSKIDFNIGDTYGNFTHKLLVDRKQKNLKKPSLSQDSDDTVIFLKCEKFIATPSPNFQEFFPKTKNRFGQRAMTITSQKSLCEFQSDHFMRKLEDRLQKSRTEELFHENRSNFLVNNDVSTQM